MLVSLLVFSIHISLFASDEDVHNKQFLQVLFGRPYTINENEQRNIEPLEKALYWCVDEFNGNTYNNGMARQYLDDLKRFGVKKIPPFEKIDFTAGYEHQRYTHRGWNWIDYPENIRGYNFKEIWKLRKALLLSTVDCVFNFKRDETIKCESLSAILYYIMCIYSAIISATQKEHTWIEFPFLLVLIIGLTVPAKTAITLLSIQNFCTICPVCFGNKQILLIIGCYHYI
jgi:hypothetical protein